MPAAGKKAEQSEATQQKLIRVSRKLFATKGYAYTSIEDITRAAKVTRGALYHHYRSKDELFAAVYEDLEAELRARIQKAIERKPPEQHLELGCKLFLDACLERDVQRIVLLDAPSVLDWESRDRVAQQYGISLIQMGIERAIEAGAMERQPVDLVARMLLGALIEAGLAIARSGNPQATRRQVKRTLDRLLAGLRGRARNGAGAPA